MAIPFLQCHDCNPLQEKSIDVGVTSTSSSDSDEQLVSNHDVSLSHSKILKLVRMQESARQNAERAVRQLERCTRYFERWESMKGMPSKPLDRSESLKRISSFVIQDDVTGEERDFTGNYYSCVYVSPIFDDGMRNVASDAQIASDNVRLQRQPFNKRQDNETGMEVKRLKAELQKRDIEINMLKSRIQQCREEKEEEAAIIVDKCVDRVNIAHESQLLLHEHSIDSSNDGSSPSSDSKNRALHATTLKRSNSCKELGKENIKDVEAVDCLKCLPLLTSLQVSVENVCNRIKTHGSRDTDVFKINCGAIEDELFILRRTLNKLTESYKGCNLCNNGSNSYAEAGKLGNSQRTLDGIMPNALQSEAKIIALESSCFEKDKKLEELEGQIQFLMEEVKCAVVEKCKLDKTLRKMCEEAQEQKHCFEELLNINGELLVFSQDKEQQIRNIKEKTQGFRAQVKEELLKLSQKLSRQQVMLNHMRDQEESLRNKNEILKLKLACTEFELAQCELALRRLTSSRLKIDGYEEASGWDVDSSFTSGSVKGDGHHYCNESFGFRSNKQQSSEVLLRKAQMCIDELEKRFRSADAEMSKYIKEMSLMFQNCELASMSLSA